MSVTTETIPTGLRYIDAHEIVLSGGWGVDENLTTGSLTLLLKCSVIISPTAVRIATS